MKDKLEQNLANFQRALTSLEVNIEKIKIKAKSDDDFDIYRDSTIQRFEYSMELSKKLMANYIEYIDSEVKGQKLILKKAFEFDLIDDDIWFKMLDDRNITSHEYSEELAQELLENIYIYAIKLRSFCEIIKSKIEVL
jgi:nucleotidyltransferase substrate binding protein (TIGR01987 family)|tara:strand:- start:54083 stop:54496 length:414 start_codon:yes stop_codon:yes gene_type:complete